VYGVLPERMRPILLPRTFMGQYLIGHFVGIDAYLEHPS
jgi:hypothetical protein